MPSDPTTEAGHDLLTQAFQVIDRPHPLIDFSRERLTAAICAIEAEARAALLDELRGEVEGLIALNPGEWVSRAAVFALFDDHKKGAAPFTEAEKAEALAALEEVGDD